MILSEYVWVFKYWLVVNWVDNVYGDCNLFCVCVLLDDYCE